MENFYTPEYNLKNDAFIGIQQVFIDKLQKLANLAKHEDWNFKNEQFKIDNNPVPILYNYIFFTYDRLKEEGKISYSEDRKSMCFNTGLQTKKFEQDIYGYFIRNDRYPEHTSQEWFFVKFCNEYDDALREFQNLPEIAEYIENASDLVFDKKLLPIRVQHEHIIQENKERFKIIGEEDEHKLHQMFEGALKIAQQRVKRNYKIAIPQFYTDKTTNVSKIQLLLPLCMNNKDKADLALVVEKDRNAYVGKTILPLDWAYMNARRIIRPDVDWIIDI